MHDGYKVVDVHAHLSLPNEAAAYAVGLMATNWAMSDPLAGGAAAKGPFVVPPDRFATSVESHVAAIDERGIDVQLIGPRPFLMLGFMEPHLLPAWTGYVNRMIRQQCDLHPDRFLGAAQLPQLSDAPDTTHCLEELDRCVDEYGFVAAYVSPDPAGRRTTPGLDQPYWHPLYARAEQLGTPLIVHGSNSLDRRFRNVPHNYQIGFLTEQYIARQCLGHSDVFDRFPALRVLICHCGGALDRFIPTDPHNPQRDLTHNLFVDSCAYDVDFLTAAIRQFGPDRMCFGTEVPGSGSAIRPDTGQAGDDLVPVLASFDWLNDTDRRKILHETPTRLCPALGKI